MIIELSAFSDKLRQYRLILQKLTSDQQDYQRRRERLSKLSQRRRSSRKPDVAECYMCNANVELESTDSFATCRGCERLVCRGENCCQWVESIGIWECTGCQSNRVIQQKAGEWLLNQLTARLKQPGPVELTDGNLLGLGLDSDDARSTVSSSTVSANQRIKVREFIEELLSGMLHGSLDDVSVGQLSKHESYIRLFRKFHTRLSRCLYNLELSIHHSLMADLPLWEGQQQHHSPSDQHFELKQLVQKILEEIGKLPELLNQSGLPLRPEEHLPYFDPRKYEQLLATAVLNKVVDDYRNPKNFANVGADDVAGKSGELGSTFDINHNKLPEGAAGHRGLLNEESLRQMSVVADESHPHEAILNGATTDRRLSDTDESYLSDYIQRHKVPLPDLSDTTGSGSGAEDDDLQSLKSNATDGTWEENWLFRKRQLKTTESSIAMLVPSPTEEVKALIGDKNADEISDLSEAGSDCEGYESDGNVKAHDSSEGRQPPVVDPTSGSSKETSEGISSSSRANDSLDEQLAPDSLVSINSLPGNEAVLSEAKNDQLLDGQVTPVVRGGNGVVEPLLVDDLISIEPIAEKVETKNPALTNPFLDDPFETNNNVITDDVKLLQRTDYRQSTSDNRSFLEPTTNGSNGPKEIPIDRANQQHTHSNISPSNPVADSVTNVAPAEHDPPDPSVADLGPHGDGASSASSSANISSRKNTNNLECLVPEASLLLLQSLTPPRSPVPQILSPHPIMMTITDVFDRMASSPLAAICEELPPMAMLDEGEDPVGQIETALGRIVEEDRSFNPFQSIDDHESIQSVHTAQGDMWSRSNSFQVEQDNSEYRTVSEATNNSLTMMDSFDEDDSNLQIDDDEAPIEDASSPHTCVVPSVAIYLRDQEEVEFSGQPDSLEDPMLTPTPDYDPFERDTGNSSRITMHPDLVTFENVPSPEGPSKIAIVTQQMRAYCEELKGILHPEDASELDPEDPTEQWEIIEAPNEPADTAPQATAFWDNSTPGDPTPIILKTVTEYSNIEHVQEAVPMEEQTQALPETRMDMDTYPRALHVSSPEPSHHTVGIGSGASTEEPPAMTTSHSTADEPELMLASIESQSESKIEDTSMPFSDTELPSLSSPLLTTSSSAINTCMPTNITDQIQACTSPNTDTNPSNGDYAENQVSQAPEPGKPTQTDADCSIIPAQKEPENGYPTQGTEQDEPLDRPDTLIPGSIAEREHLKWRNAKPIANNPYSPDALQRRLSEKTRPSSMIEIDRLVRKEAPSDVIICEDDPPGGQPVGSPTKHEASEPVNGSALSEKKKIGREYYINDPDRLRMGGGGTVKQTLGHVQHPGQSGPAHSTDDEKSLLLGRNLDEAAPKTDSSLLPETAPDAALQQKSPKANYLNAVAREIFLLPLEPESEMRSLMSSSSEQSVTSPRQDFDSLTYSEDSDVTRIYDLTTGEAKVIRSGVVQALPRDPAPPEPEGNEEGDTILRILPQQPPAPSQTPNTDSQTPPQPPPEDRTFLRPVQMVVKPLSPETIKFFAPKRKLSFTGSNNNLTASATESAPTAMHSSLHIEFPASRTPCGSEFSIIEKDVIDVLPSVKELAKCYSGSTSDVSSLPPKPLYKPRDFLRQSSDMLSEETVTIDEKTGMPCTKGQRQYCSTSSIAVRDEIREIRKINLEAYRQSTYYPMAPGHSITARSLSKQIREHKTNVTDDHKVGQQEEVVEPTGNDGDNGHTSPERPSSPVLLPGHLKSSIEFFESLKNHQ